MNRRRTLQTYPQTFGTNNRDGFGFFGVAVVLITESSSYWIAGLFS